MLKWQLTPTYKRLFLPENLQILAQTAVKNGNSKNRLQNK